MKLLYNGIVRLCWNKNVKEFFNYDKDGNIGEIEDGFGGAGTQCRNDQRVHDQSSAISGLLWEIGR